MARKKVTKVETINGVDLFIDAERLGKEAAEQEPGRVATPDHVAANGASLDALNLDALGNEQKGVG